MIDLPALPGNPGCYLFSAADGTIIYIGKAKNLKKRVSSYFQKRDHDPKTQSLVERIDTVNYIVTSNEVEALILENSLIKTHQPRYNIDLKDAKQYAYIELTDEEFPCIRIARRPGSHGSFFGPFVSAAERDYVYSVVKKVFRLRTCSNLKRRACLRYHIHTCSGPCIREVSSEEYGEQIRKATMVLRGRSSELVSLLREEMAKFSGDKNYELAMKVRDQISAVERLGGRQDVARPVDAEEDILNYITEEGRVYLMVFPVHGGTLANKKEFVFDYHDEFLEEFLVQYYSATEPPPEIILPEPVSAPMEEFLSEKRGKKVTVTVPQRGTKRRLLDLVRMNIETVFFGNEIKLHELKDHLGLVTIPRVIECFDISHIAGTSVVGSMVRFRDGRPDKQGYRRFRIKTVEGVDDVSAIGEVVRRRYTRLVKECGALPDLIMVDGGKGQLHAAVRETQNLGITTPVIALAKREEQVYMQGHAYPLPIDRKERASLFLQEIRDEAHRFAIAYHRLLREKKSVGG